MAHQAARAYPFCQVTRLVKHVAALAKTALAGLAIGLLAGLLAGAAGPAPASAQAYPSQLVRIVVPFSAGSQSDILGRAYADKLQERWKRDVIVENRPGLAGTAMAAKAPPDGYTLLLVSNGHALIESLNSNLTFDPVKDFVGIGRIAVAPGIMVVTPDGGGPKTVKELIAAAKAKPGAFNYASAGLGSASSIGVELLKAQAGINLVHVPYRGTPEANTSVIRGDTVLFMSFFSAGGDLIQANRLHAIAVTTAKRLAVLPDVPTMQEAGLADYAYDPWFGLLAPAGTPRAIVDAVNKAVVETAKLPDHLERFTRLGVDLSVSTPQEFDALVKSDTERFTRLFGKASN
jgi:tripartite-type tricarboxylate transporter receptor subunit TctC